MGPRGLRDIKGRRLIITASISHKGERTPACQETQEPGYQLFTDSKKLICSSLIVDHLSISPKSTRHFPPC